YRCWSGQRRSASRPFVVAAGHAPCPAHERLPYIDHPAPIGHDRGEGASCPAGVLGWLGAPGATSPGNGRGPRTVCGVTEIMSGATEMARLVERSAQLKDELLDFSQGKRFDRALSDALTAKFGSVVVAAEEELINFFDNFVLQHRLSDGRTVLERFVRARGDLPRADRELLLGWRGVLEAFFEVERLDGEVLVAVNLIDELTYRIRTNMDPAIFERFPPGSFLGARVVPILDEWLLSGSQAAFSAEQAERLYEIAAETAMEHPHLVFRNPQRLELAWEQQREVRARFIDFFGADLVVFPGAEWGDRVNACRLHRSDGATSPPRMNAASL